MKTSIYFSDKLQKQILPLYVESFHSEKVKNNTFSFIAGICDFCKKDYLEIGSLQAQGYFNSFFLPDNTKKKKPALSTIHLKHASFHAFSNYLIRNAALFEIRYFNNPFDSIHIEQASPYLDIEKVPTLFQMNDILKKAEAIPSLYAALSLIIKCGLTVGELLRLKQDSFFLDDAEQAAAVFTYRGIQRYVKIPEDVLAILDNYWKNQVFHTEYLFENKAGNPMRVRDIERLYKKCMGEQFQFTLSDLRNGCIAVLAASGVSSKDIGKYTGIQQYHWLHRFDKIIPELSLAPCDYTNLYIKLPTSNTVTEAEPTKKELPTA